MFQYIIYGEDREAAPYRFIGGRADRKTLRLRLQRRSVCFFFRAAKRPLWSGSHEIQLAQEVNGHLDLFVRQACFILGGDHDLDFIAQVDGVEIHIVH